MQSRLAIAALLGAVSARDLSKLNHVLVQAAKKNNVDISHGIQELTKNVNKQLQDAEDALEDAQDLLDEVSDAADEILTHDVTVAPERSSADVKKLEDIVGGLLKGALDAEGFSDINSCISDAETIFQDAEEAVKDFETKDISKIAEGVKKVADILTTVQKGMSDCSHLKADWKKLEAMAAVFSSPQAFAYHVGKDLMVNGVDIFHEIQDSVTQYQSQNWTQFGVDIGEAAAKILLGAESQIQLGATEEQVRLAQIEQGLLKAFGGKFDILALLECIGDEDKALLIFDAAYQQFEEAIQKKNPQDAIGGLIMIVAGLAQFKQGLPACKAIDTTTFNYDQLVSTYDIAAHPTQHFELLEHDVLVNGASIKKDIRLAVQSYRKGQYDYFGWYVGTILELATRPAENKALPVPQEDEEVFTRAMVAEVAQGFLEATNVGTFNFTNLLLCIYEADQAALVLYEGVNILEQAYKDKDPDEAIGGIIAVIAFVQQLKQTLPVCEAVDSKTMNWGTFDEIVEIAENPEQHMRIIDDDLIFNEATITEEVSEALDAFRSEDYKTFGYMLGDAMTLATDEKLTIY